MPKSSNVPKSGTQKLTDRKPSSRKEDSSKSTSTLKSKKIKLLQLSSAIDNNTGPRTPKLNKSNISKKTDRSTYLLDVNVSAAKVKATAIAGGHKKKNESSPASISKSKSSSSSSAKKPPPPLSPHHFRAVAKKRETNSVAQRHRAVKCGMMMRSCRKVLKTTLRTVAVIAFIAWVVMMLVFIFFEGENIVTECKMIRCASIAVKWNYTTGRTEFSYSRVKQGEFEYYTQIGIDDDEPCRSKPNNGSKGALGVCRFDECVNITHSELHPVDRPVFKFQSNYRTLNMPIFKYFCMNQHEFVKLGFEYNDLSSANCLTDEDSCNTTIQFYVRTSICSKADRITGKELQETNCWGHPDGNPFFQNISDTHQNPPVLTFACNSCQKRWDVAKASLNCQNKTGSVMQCRHGNMEFSSLNGNPCCLYGANVIGRCYLGLCWPAL